MKWKEQTVPEKRQRLKLRFFNFIAGEAEGRFAIGALALIVITLAALRMWE
jgi:hypothetical protein